MSAHMSRPKRLAALGLAVVLLVAGFVYFQSQDQDDGSIAQPPACGMLSAETVNEITGSIDLFSSGGIEPRSDEGGSASCMLVEPGSGTAKYLQIVGSDYNTGEYQDLLTDEKQKIRGCTELKDVAGGGYVCVRTDSVDAAVALPTRLVRITVFGNAQMDQATPENVLNWAKEIDQHLTEHVKK